MHLRLGDKMEMDPTVQESCHPSTLTLFEAVDLFMQPSCAVPLTVLMYSVFAVQESDLTDPKVFFLNIFWKTFGWNRGTHPLLSIPYRVIRASCFTGTWCHMRKYSCFKPEFWIRIQHFISKCGSGSRLCHHISHLRFNFYISFTFSFFSNFPLFFSSLRYLKPQFLQNCIFIWEQDSWYFVENINRAAYDALNQFGVDLLQKVVWKIRFF